MSVNQNKAPDWSVSQWFNTDNAISLAQLRGKVVVLHAFQMLCPGCVSHGLPQAQRLHDYFSRDDVAVIGLHTVFEHHSAMTPTSLEAFIHEYRLTFPIGVDTANDQMNAEGRAGGLGHNANTPVTMARYEMRGTPTLILIDREGMLRANYFGRPEDLQIGAEVAALVNMSCIKTSNALDANLAQGCADEKCAT